MDLRDYLIVGSYLFGAGAYVLLYRAISQLQASIDKLRVALAYNHGKVAGQDHEERLIHLERVISSDSRTLHPPGLEHSPL